MLVGIASDFANGAGEAKTDAHLRLCTYPHDMIKFFASSANSHLDALRDLYQKGLSLRDISLETGLPVSTIRDVLVLSKVPLRTNKKTTDADPEKPGRAFRGAIPFGQNVLDRKLVVDAKEVKVFRKILAYNQKKMSFNAIAKQLNMDRIPSKLGRKWSDKMVAAIIRRTKLA